MGKIVAFIPVRGNSKSIPLKNIKNIAGKPLVFWVIEAALESDYIAEVFVATDSDEIREEVAQITNSKLKIISRGKDTATDTATTESAMLEFAKKTPFDEIILIQATSPLLTTSDLENALKLLKKEKGESLLSVVRQKRFIWKIVNGIAFPENYDYKNRPRRQVFGGFFVENGAFYITSRDLLLRSKCRLSGKIVLYEMAGESYYELDEPHDWIVVEQLLKARSKGTVDSFKLKLKSIKLFITDVDGVLTDAGMYYSQVGEMMKKFNTRDGKGIENIKELGVKTCIMTSENTEIVKKRAQKLKIDFLQQSAFDKAVVAKKLKDQLGLSWEQIAFIGDDANDTGLLKKVGFSACPSNGIEDNKKIVSYVCVNPGGHGCVREICDLISKSKEND